MGANTSDADFLTSLGRGRGTGSSQLYKQSPNAAGASVWGDFFFDGGAASVTGVVATSQAQTIVADGSFSASSGIDGTAATSQAQTISASGSSAVAAVSGSGTTYQAQTIAGSGSASVASVSGTISTSQAQTIAAIGSAAVASVSGEASTSQAETIAGSGSFSGASVVSGDAATSQVQTIVADGSFTSTITDTHDGFWRKQWEEIAKQSKATKKLEKKKKAIEANDLPIVELVKETTVIETAKPIKAKSNRLIVDRVIEFNYDANDEDEDLLMLW